MGLKRQCGFQDNCANNAFASFRSRVSKPAGSSIQRFDERWEGDLIFAFISGPHADLLAALPLNGNQRDQPRSVFQGVGELIIAAVELDGAHRSDVVGRFECSHHVAPVPGKRHEADVFARPGWALDRRALVTTHGAASAAA